MSSLQLCGYLLSANEAVQQRDNFNQLASALSPARIRSLLERRWDVKSAIDCRRVIEQRLRKLGKAAPEETVAFTAWSDDSPIDSEIFEVLQETCDRLHECDVVGSARQIGAAHLGMAAWDIQQIAYIVRLGHAVDFVSRSMAETTLARLHASARAHYASWRDFSLSTLVASGVRGQVAAADRSGWRRLAQSHELLLATVEVAALCMGPGNAPARPAPEARGLRARAASRRK